MFDRFTLIDLFRTSLAKLATPKVYPTLPETTPTPVPETPLEILKAECAELGVQVYDLRDLEKWPRNKAYDWREWGWPGDKSRAMPKGTRSWNELTAVCLHTYAVAGMTWKRFLGVPCHAGIASNGDIVLCHDLTRIVWHGNAANKFSAGIEISGPGRFDNPDIQAAAGKALLRYIKAERNRNRNPHAKFGGPTMYIMGHRMAAKGKPNCPGKQIWQSLGEWSLQEGLYEMGPIVGDGRSIDLWR